MFRYAQLDKNNICVSTLDSSKEFDPIPEGVIDITQPQRPGSVSADPLSDQQEVEQNVLGKRYVDGEWLEVEQPVIKEPEAEPIPGTFKRIAARGLVNGARVEAGVRQYQVSLDASLGLDPSKCEVILNGALVAAESGFPVLYNNLTTSTLTIAFPALSGSASLYFSYQIIENN